MPRVAPLSQRNKLLLLPPRGRFRSHPLIMIQVDAGSVQSTAPFEVALRISPLDRSCWGQTSLRNLATCKWKFSRSSIRPRWDALGSTTIRAPGIAQAIEYFYKHGGTERLKRYTKDALKRV